MCILLVDDEPIIVMAAEQAFQDAGHKVMTAGHVPGAIRLIADHPGHFTCLVTDLHMPHELSGADLVEHMRVQYSEIPMVLTTGRPDAVIAKWLDRHRVTLLEKPYSLPLMVETVEQLLSCGPHCVKRSDGDNQGVKP